MSYPAIPLTCSGSGQPIQLVISYLELASLQGGINNPVTWFSGAFFSKH